MQRVQFKRCVIPLLAVIGAISTFSFLVTGPHQQARAANPTKISVFDTTAGTTLSINSTDIDYSHQYKLDGTIESSDVTDSLGNHQTTLHFNAVAIATTDSGTNGARGSATVYTFPEGLIFHKGTVIDARIAGTGSLTTTAAVVGALGSVAADATDTLTSTEVDYLPSGAATLSSGTSLFKGVTATAALFDGTGTAKVIKANFACPDASSSGSGTVTLSGNATVNWALMGDK